MVRAMGQVPVVMLVAWCGSGPLAVSGQCWTPELGTGYTYDGTFYYCDDAEPSANACEDIETLVVGGQVEICAGISTVPQCTMASCTSSSGADGTLVIPDSVTALSDGSFEKAKTSYDDGIVAVQWGSGLTKINKRAFYRSNLVSVDIPNGITEIGRTAFASSAAMTSATIPASLQSLGPYMFNECRALASITISSQLAATEIPDGFCRFCEALTSLVIPDSVTSVGAFSFYGTASLTSLTVGSGVQEIKNAAFRGSGLTEVTFPEGLLTLRSQAFRDSQICSVVLPASLTTIESAVFDTACAQTVTICAMGSPATLLGFSQCVVGTQTGTSLTDTATTETTSISTTSTGTDTATTETTSISTTSTGTDTATTVTDTATTDSATTVTSATTTYIAGAAAAASAGEDDCDNFWGLWDQCEDAGVPQILVMSAGGLTLAGSCTFVAFKFFGRKARSIG